MSVVVRIRLRTKDPKLMEDPRVRAWLQECERKIADEMADYERAFGVRIVAENTEAGGNNGG
jgi:hypothetical protein